MLNSRPLTRQRSAIRVAPRRRRWHYIRWRHSLLLVISLALAAATYWGDFSPATITTSSAYLWLRHVHQIRVVDAYSGQPVHGAVVRVGETAVVTGADGRVDIRSPKQTVEMVVERSGYETAREVLSRSGDRRHQIALRPTTLSGRIVEADTGTAISNATVSLADDKGSVLQTVTTDADGQFSFTGVPQQARLVIDAGDFGTIDEPVGNRSVANYALRKSILFGVVTDEDGHPIADATVLAGAVSAATSADGGFRMRNAPPDGEVTVSASGYKSQKFRIPQDRKIVARLQPFDIRGLYFSPIDLGNEAALDSMIRLVDETELNAIVIDIKQDMVFYDTGVQFFHDAKAVDPVYDAREVVKKLHDHGIYAIARLVVFKDPVVAENRHDLAVKDEITGDVWRDLNGYAWVNPFERELWQANIDLAVEAAKLGFDEIQYDYVRFPSDGDLSTADFGQEYTEESRVGAITEFLRLSREQLRPTGAKLGADIFGIVALVDNDQGIGQRVADVAKVVDYVCPMVYPSHFTAGAVSVGGEPNDYPYETIKIAMAKAKQGMPGMTRKLRPWLQDFSFPGMKPYGKDEVQAQITAALEEGASGWMLWNPGNVYTAEALGPPES